MTSFDNRVTYLDTSFSSAQCVAQENWSVSIVADLAAELNLCDDRVHLANWIRETHPWTGL